MRKEIVDFALAVKCVFENNPIRSKFDAGVLTLGCLAALDYRMRHEQILLTDKKRHDAFVFLQLGKIINNYHDSCFLDESNYRKLRRDLFSTPLRNDQFNFFFKKIAGLERVRPNPWSSKTSCFEQIKRYRSQVNLVYWTAACVSIGIARTDELITSDLEYTPSSPTWFHGMHDALLALQVIDDKIGWRGDLRLKRPSFFTALCPQNFLNFQPERLPPQAVETTFRRMDEEFTAYTARAKQELPDDYGLLTAIVALNRLPCLLNSQLYRNFQNITGIELINDRHFNE